MDHVQQNYSLNHAHWQEFKSASWQKTTVTWSFADFNTSAERIKFDGFITNADFQEAIRAAFAEWASVANLEFIESDDTSGVDVRIGFGDLDGARGVLATTDYFYSGTMLKESFIRFDTAESWQSSLTSNSQTPTYLVALHEIGHALGLGHSTTGADTVMKATLNRGAEGLGADDIEGIQKLYGAVAERQTEAGSAPDALAGTGCGCGCGDSGFKCDNPDHQPDASTQTPNVPGLTPDLSQALGDTTEAVVYRLYLAAFDRAPDADGFGFWVDLAADALDFTAIAQTMMESDEFQANYADATTSKAFVETLYENILDRDGEADGIGFWSHMIDNGSLSRADVLAQFAESHETMAHLTAAVHADDHLIF
ncbi:MAG: matrixin family metalloprotease [Pseudomonadota bacterium]|nr:matrixin family metalloprotease [Pseudomonadota bacterium]